MYVAGYMQAGAGAFEEAPGLSRAEVMVVWLLGPVSGPLAKQRVHLTDELFLQPLSVAFPFFFFFFF